MRKVSAVQSSKQQKVTDLSKLYLDFYLTVSTDSYLKG